MIVQHRTTKISGANFRQWSKNTDESKNDRAEINYLQNKNFPIGILSE